MRIKPNQYARSLYEMVDGKSKEQSKEVIKNFTEVLVKHNQLTKVDGIINEFIKIWNKKKKIIEAQAISARELSNDVIKNIKNYIAEVSEAKEVSLINYVDKNIIGGVIIKYGDKVLDGSLKARLSDLKSKLIK